MNNLKWSFLRIYPASRWEISYDKGHKCLAINAGRVALLIYVKDFDVYFSEKFLHMKKMLNDWDGYVKNRLPIEREIKRDRRRRNNWRQLEAQRGTILAALLYGRQGG